MVTIHTSNTHQPATLITHKVGEAPGNADRVDNTTTTATIESEPQVSGQAKMLSTLYASAMRLRKKLALASLFRLGQWQCHSRRLYKCRKIQ